MGAREEILDAFCACAVEKPFDAISVGDICTKAGVSKKTYYNYFTSRQELVSAVTERDFFQPQRQLRESLFSDQLDANAGMLLQLTYETFFRKQGLYKVLIKGLGEAEFFQEFARLSFQLNREVYAPLQEQTPDEEAELDYMCMFLSSTSAHSLQWWMRRGFEPEPPRMAELYRRWALARIEGQDTPFPAMCNSTARR